MEIDARKIATGLPTYIIAEIGINHNGNIDLAFKMIDSAAKCGVDAIKFQIVTADKCYAKNSESYPIFKKLEFSKQQWQQIIAHTKKQNIAAIVTFASIEDLKDYTFLDLAAIKVSSTNITNFPLLENIAKLNKPIILSTGISYLSEVDEAMRFLENSQVAILQCTSLYPTLPKNANLNAIKTLQCAFPSHPVGFSDHTLGVHCAIASVAIGACVIEKHFTLDRNMEGHDHHFSATPDEMENLVALVREIESAMGSLGKKPVTDEIPLRAKLQRSLVLSQDMKAGETITEDKIIAKRSSVKGLEPKFYKDILGKKISKDQPKDTPITFDVI